MSYGGRRRFGNPDTTQQDAVDLVRRTLLATVAVTTGVGGGFFDNVIGFQGLTVLAEMKTPGGALRPSQERFIREWKGGPLVVADSPELLVRQLIELDRRTPPVRGIPKRFTSDALILECMKAAEGLILDNDELPALIRQLRATAPKAAF